MELNDELFRLTDVTTEAIYPDAMIADCYIYLFDLASKVSKQNLYYLSSAHIFFTMLHVSL